MNISMYELVFAGNRCRTLVWCPWSYSVMLWANKLKLLCLVFYSLPAVSIQNWVRHHHSIDYGFWQFHQHRPAHVECCVIGCFASLHSINRFILSTVCRSGAVTVATLSGLPARLVTPSSVRSQCRSSVDRRSSSFGPHYRHSRQFSPERIKFMVYWGLHCTMPLYLADSLQYAANILTRGRLQSLTSSHLDVRPSRLVTVRDRSFTFTSPKLQNSLPSDV